MSRSHELVPLPPAAKDYVRAVLGDGKSIAQLVAGSASFQRGTAFALLPAGVSLPGRPDYSIGGVTSSELSTRFLQQFLLSRYGRDHHHLVMFENRYARPDDKVLTQY